MKFNVIQKVSVLIILGALALLLATIYLNGNNNQSQQSELSGVKKGVVREVEIKVKGLSPSPAVINIKAGEQTLLKVKNDGAVGCSNTLVSKSLFEDPIYLPPEGEIAQKQFIAPDQKGEYSIVCTMGHFNLKVNVI